MDTYELRKRCMEVTLSGELLVPNVASAESVYNWVTTGDVAHERKLAALELAMCQIHLNRKIFSDVNRLIDAAEQILAWLSKE